MRKSALNVGIYGIIASQGDGKTSLATAMALGELKNHKRKIIANYTLGFKSLYLDFDTIVKMLDSGNLPDTVRDVNGDMVLFNPLVKRKFGFVPKSVDQIFQNAVVIADELHVAAHSYNFLGKSSQVIANFISQIRKRDVLFLFTTQRMRKVAKMIRDEVTNYIVPSKTDLPDIYKIELCEPDGQQDVINVRYIDLKYVYRYFHTKQIIRYETPKTPKETKKKKSR